jgi:hypothetical protein
LPNYFGNQIGWHREGLTSRPYGREVFYWQY